MFSLAYINLTSMRYITILLRSLEISILQITYIWSIAMNCQTFETVWTASTQCITPLDTVIAVIQQCVYTISCEPLYQHELSLCWSKTVTVCVRILPRDKHISIVLHMRYKIDALNTHSIWSSLARLGHWKIKLHANIAWSNREYLPWTHSISFENMLRCKENATNMHININLNYLEWYSIWECVALNPTIRNRFNWYCVDFEGKCYTRANSVVKWCSYHFQLCASFRDFSMFYAFC